MSGNEQIADAISSGIPCRRNVNSVITPNVPSEPTINFVRSYPAEDFLALEPVLIIRPSDITTFRPITFSFIVPYLTAVVPEARVAAIPPIEALAPGSTGKNNPNSFKLMLSSSLVIPGCTVTSISSGFTFKIFFMFSKDKVTPPFTGIEFPSRLVPVPQGITGHLCLLHISMTSETSFSSFGYATASGSISL